MSKFDKALTSKVLSLFHFSVSVGNSSRTRHRWRWNSIFIWSSGWSQLGVPRSFSCDVSWPCSCTETQLSALQCSTSAKAFIYRQFHSIAEAVSRRGTQTFPYSLFVVCLFVCWSSSSSSAFASAASSSATIASASAITIWTLCTRQFLFKEGLWGLEAL